MRKQDMWYIVGIKIAEANLKGMKQLLLLNAQTKNCTVFLKLNFTIFKENCLFCGGRLTNYFFQIICFPCLNHSGYCSLLQEKKRAFHFIMLNYVYLKKDISSIMNIDYRTIVSGKHCFDSLYTIGSPNLVFIEFHLIYSVIWFI